MKPFLPALVALATISLFDARSLAQTNWASSVKLPPAERKSKIPLFNGRDLTGWEGQTSRFWSVVNGQIRGANTDRVPASTYLWTQKSFRNFRLLFEVKQSRNPTLSTTHSAVAVLGEKMVDQEDPFSFRGPLLMFCNDWGIWDANRRNRIFPAGHQGTLQSKAENVGQWNRIEVLILGDHIRMVANGQSVIDFTDSPGMLKPCPIGLQLHSNDRPQEFFFRGLILSENPVDRLLTLTPPTK
jgi:hypothetical protein